MKNALLLAVLLSSISAFAREPQYYCNAIGSGNYFPFGSPGGVGSKVQLLYQPGDFSALPQSGVIRSIYFKAFPVKEFSGKDGCTDLTIKIGSSDSVEFSRSGGRFIEPVVTCFYAEQYQLQFDGAGWMQPIILETPYNYSCLSNLIIEISVGKASSVKFVCYDVKSGTRRMWGAEGAATAIAGDGGLYAIGFDVDPLAPCMAEGIASYEPALANAAGHAQQAAPAATVSKPDASNSRDNSAIERTSDKLFLFCAALMGIMCIAVLAPFLPRARRLAHWAFKNPGKTKWMLIGAQVFTSVTGIALGKRLFDEGIITSDLTSNTLFAVAAAGTLLYPRRQTNTEVYGRSYRKQKLLSLLLAVTGLALVTTLGNRIAADRKFSPLAANAMLAVDKNYYDSPAATYASYNAYAAEAKADPLSRGGRITLSVLATILMVVLMILVCVGTCWLICIEQPVWAALLFFGGGGGVIYGFIRALRALRADGPRVRRY